MAAPRELNPRRAAVAARIKAQGPQPRPTFRSGVDIDACHYRVGAVASIPQGGINRDQSAGCRKGDTSVRRRRLDVTGGQLPPHQQVAAPDDRPQGEPAGAGPEQAEG